MMFDLRIFIKTGLMDAVGKLADYQVILNAAGWHEKGVLTTEDLADIQTAIEAQYIVEETDMEEEPDVDVHDVEESVIEEEPVEEEPAEAIPEEEI